MSADSLAGKGSLCELAALSPAEADAVLAAHIARFIRPAHFDWLAAHGINTLRVPLGWWNVVSLAAMPDVGVGPAWRDFAPSLNASLTAIDNVFAWASARGMRVLLDLHGGPGGQNSKDHSGCGLQSSWHRHNAADSVLVIRTLMERYGRHPALWGIELLNEPGDLVEPPDEKAIAPRPRLPTCCCNHS